MAAGLALGRRRGDDRERAHRLVRARPAYREVLPLAIVLLVVALRPAARRRRGARVTRARRPHRRRARRGGPRARSAWRTGTRRRSLLVVARRARPRGRAVVGARRLGRERLLPRARGDGALARGRARRDAVARTGRVHGDRRVHRRGARRRRPAGRASRPTLVGVAAAAAAGVLAGAGVVRLRPVFIAVTTWILTWTVALFLLAFRSVLGRRARRRRCRRRSRSTAHYELALALLVARDARSPRRSRAAGRDRAARRAAGAGRRGGARRRRPRGAGSARSSPRRRSAVSPAPRGAARGCRGRGRVRAVPLVQALRRGA